MEREFLYAADKGEGGGAGILDEKFKKKIETLEAKVNKQRGEKKALNTENEFYTQSTKLFLTIFKYLKKQREILEKMSKE